MTLIQPAALGALVALPLIVMLYILRPRHRRLVVPSVRLWQHLPSDLEGKPRWRLPVTSLLLIAQLLIAGTAAFALARPGIPGAVRQHLIIVLDTSPSMMATDVSPSRLAVAVSQARALAHGLTSDDEATLIAMGPTPRVIAAGKGAAALDAALDQVQPAANTADFTDALLLASQSAQQSMDSHNRIVVFSDGASPGPDLSAVGQIPADVSFRQVGSSSDNQAITALTVRPMIGSTDRYVGFVQMTNYGQQDVTVPFTARADGLAISQGKYTIPARGYKEVALSLPVGTRLMSVQITSQDKYHSDDAAEVLVPNSQEVTVDLVAADPTFWQRALQPLPNAKVHVVSPTAYRPGGAAVTIFVDFVPSALPSGNVVLVNPPAGNKVIPVNAQAQNVAIVHADNASPLMGAVDLTGQYIPALEVFQAVNWAQSVADTEVAPAILAGQQGGRQIVVIGFDPAGTDWPQQTSFPVFVANLVDSMIPQVIPPGVSAGSVLDIAPTPGASKLLVQLPDGKTDVFDASRAVRFADTSELGRYIVTATDGKSAISQHEFVVNRLGIPESNIAPQVDPNQITRSASPDGTLALHEIWPWLAGGVLALLTAEWVFFFRKTAG
ncbi:MAG TPA: BatA and WFA domain-containing protein [Chloroflexota bacterium]|nr:BatA and WFA domain-containing protein [Chloroflexota bacterium]